MPKFTSNSSNKEPRYGLARVISKRGICSRSEAERWIRAGRVSVGGKVITDPESPFTLTQSHIEIDGDQMQAGEFVYYMLNKPRGLVTTASDESNRDTVYQCLQGKGLPWLAPVGRLDKASEGLLLFSNDSEWAAQITSPQTHLNKTYHVQISQLLDDAKLLQLREGVAIDGEKLSAVSLSVLRSGEKNCWLEIVLNEGRNRHIRRLLEHFEIEVLRLIRVAIGDLVLGDLAKSALRQLSHVEVLAIAKTGRSEMANKPKTK